MAITDDWRGYSGLTVLVYVHERGSQRAARFWGAISTINTLSSNVYALLALSFPPVAPPADYTFARHLEP